MITKLFFKLGTIFLSKFLSLRENLLPNNSKLSTQKLSSYNSSGNPSGSEKKLKRFPVNSSFRIGSVEMFFAFNSSMVSSKFSTPNAKCRSPVASGRESRLGGSGKEKSSIT